MIENVHSYRFDNANHLKFSGDAAALIERHNPETLKVATLFETYRVLVQREDSCYKIIRKSDLSALKADADQRRDEALTGINEVLRTALRHFDVDVKAAANRLQVLIQGYNSPKPLANLPYEAETVSVVNLLQELNGKYADTVQATGLAPWVAELERRNTEFVRLATAALEETVEKPPFRLKDVRREVDAAWQKIVLVINANLVTDGEEQYAPFVAALNALVKSFNDLLAQHLGRNKAKAKAKIS